MGIHKRAALSAFHATLSWDVAERYCGTPAAAAAHLRCSTIIDLHAVKPILHQKIDVLLVVRLAVAVIAHRRVPSFHADAVVHVRAHLLNVHTSPPTVWVGEHLVGRVRAASRGR